MAADGGVPNLRGCVREARLLAEEISLMRAVIQRVSEARVSIGGAVKGAIQNGLAVLLAVEEADTAEDIEWQMGRAHV